MVNPPAGFCGGRAVQEHATSRPPSTHHSHRRHSALGCLVPRSLKDGGSRNSVTWERFRGKRVRGTATQKTSGSILCPGEDIRILPKEVVISEGAGSGFTLHGNGATSVECVRQRQALVSLRPRRPCGSRCPLQAPRVTPWLPTTGREGLPSRPLGALRRCPRLPGWPIVQLGRSLQVVDMNDIPRSRGQCR